MPVKLTMSERIVRAFSVSGLTASANKRTRRGADLWLFRVQRFTSGHRR